MITLFYSNIALPNNFVDKDLESKIQDDLRLDKECYPEAKVESFVLKALVRDQPLLFPVFGRIRDYILVSDQL